MIGESLLVLGAAEIVKNFVKDVIAPKIKQLADNCEDDLKELLNKSRDHFETYLTDTYKKLSIINTLVLGNQQCELKELYLPLTISTESIRKKKVMKSKIETYPKDLVKEYNNRILITDTAGMGKSTLMKRIFLDVVENGHGIPFYIELYKLSKENSILDEIQKQANLLSKEFDRDLLLRLIQSGGFIFLLDGYDEISLENREFVMNDLKDFISKANKNVFFLTSRPEDALNSFGDFQRFEINDLEIDEAYELLRKYDYNGETAEKLIVTLKTGQYEMIEEFLKNPLLVSLLYTAFNYENRIPISKYEFYEQVYDAFFEKHDLTKGDDERHKKRSRLNRHNFVRILRFIGFKCLQRQKISFNRNDMLLIIEEAKKMHTDLKFDSSDFLKDLVSSVPLFYKDGLDFRWAHKSLQEYFAAEFIYMDSNINKEKILQRIYNNPLRHMNLLDLYYDIDPLGFEKNIKYPFLKEFIDYYESNFFKSDFISPTLIDERISLSFSKRVILQYSSDDKSAWDPILKEYMDDFRESRIGLSSHIFSDGFRIFNIVTINQEIIRQMLFMRNKDLFISSSPTIDEINSSLEKLIPIIKERVKFDLAITTGDKDEDLYIAFNHALWRLYLNSKTGPDGALNYSKCKNELKQIESREIVEKEFDFTEGL